MPLLNPSLKLIGKGEWIMGTWNAGWFSWLVCVSSRMAFCKGTERLANWSSRYTERWTGVNAPITGASLSLASMESVRQVPCKKMPRNNWTKAGWFPVRFSSWPWHNRTKFHSPTNFREILGTCQRRIHMFCRPQESMWLDFSWKTLGSVAGAAYGVEDRLLLAVKSLYSCSQSVSVSVELNYNRSP